VRQSALYKQVARLNHRPPKGRPTPPLHACIFYALGGEWYESADEAKLRGMCKDKPTHVQFNGARETKNRLPRKRKHYHLRLAHASTLSFVRKTLPKKIS
jgi:hypothetical protein